MPIVDCPQCQSRFKVPDQVAGKRIKCPKCGGGIPVPPLEVAAAMPSAPPVPPPDRWYLTAATGDQFGPVPRAELDSWVAAGNVTSDCQVLREGDPQWQWAHAVYPQLAPAPAVLPPVDTGPTFSIPDPLASRRRQPPDTDQTGGASQRLLTSIAHPPGGLNSFLVNVTGVKDSLVSRCLQSEAKASQRGVRVGQKQWFQIGDARGWREHLRSGSMVGWYTEKSSDPDLLDTLQLQEAHGHTHVLMPLDSGQQEPCEFVSVLPGRLPVSVALVRGGGGNWGFEAAGQAGPFLGAPLSKMLQVAGSGQPTCGWAALGAQPDHPAVSVLESNPKLKEGVRFDCQLNLGQLSILHKLTWFAQAMPLDAHSFLLVVQIVPRNKMLMGLDCYLEWYFNWRDELLRTIAALPLLPQEARQFMDPGLWHPYAAEVLGIPL